jgi:hypothetical protein
MIENLRGEIRQLLPRRCLFLLVSLGDFLRKKAFSRNPEITVKASERIETCVWGLNRSGLFGTLGFNP